MTPAETATWSDPLVLRLAGRTRDPVAAIEALTGRWLQEARISRLPVDVFGLASLRGIKVRRVEDLPAEGRVFAELDGRIVMEVNASRSTVRQRFTCAHELIHTAFPGFARDGRFRVADDLTDVLAARSRSEEERLCDAGAAALLMPVGLLWSYDLRQGLRGVQKLARDANVSLEAAAGRLLARSDRPGVFVVAEEGVAPRRVTRTSPPAPPRLMVRYALATGGPVRIARHTPIEPGSVLDRAAMSRSLQRATEPLPGQSPKRYAIEARAFPRRDGQALRRRVLAIAWPAG